MLRSVVLSGFVMLMAFVPDDPPAQVIRKPSGVPGPLVIEGVGLLNGVMARPDEANPIIRGKNLYAPDLVKNGGAWNLYYGGWRDPADLNDRIYASVSEGLSPSGTWKGGNVIMDVGNYLHVNDPSVQRLGPDWWIMAFTMADRRDGHDWIGVAFSRDGLTFEPRVASPQCEIQVSGAPFTFMGRPSLIRDGRVWKLWFDGKVNGGPLHSYLAESLEPFPRNFRLIHTYSDVDGFPGFFAPDVEKMGDRYVAVVQRQFLSLVKLESRDGVHFDEVGTILRVSDPSLGKKVISNPGWIADPSAGRILGVAVSLSDDVRGLTSQSIGLAYHQLGVEVRSPPNVTHRFAHARGFDAAVPMTFGYHQFDHLRIENPSTHEAIFDQPLAATEGDILRLVPPPPAPQTDEIPPP